MTNPHIKNILWTATDVPLPKGLWGRLEEMGYRVLLAERDGNTLARIRKISPQLWVEQVNGDPEAVFSGIRAVREGCPALPIILLSHQPSVEAAVDAIKMGVLDYLPGAVPQDRLWAALEGGLRSAVVPRPQEDREARKIPELEPPIAADPAMQKIVELALRIAPSRSTVLIQGESGTGKEVVARTIHGASGRRKGPFVAVNCAALPENLLESELFGHERGAFTGAVARKRGKFELASGGTLLLDEISEMAMSVQAKLLRVLQEREIDRVGGDMPIPIDTRVIATTNRDLEEETRKGNFRLDLYYRLNVVPLALPPLRKRTGDIIPLAECFLRRHSELNGVGPKKLSRDGEEFLKGRTWPGNVRELENLMERAGLLVESDLITREDLRVLSLPEPEPGTAGPVSMGVIPLREMEKKMIQTALQEHGGNRTHAAEVLGISVRTLRNKLHEYRKEMEREGFEGQEIES
ncbi:MAG: sigma-54 dependent transcriptional regulator [Thermodesulfobacteriota bacterium]